MPDRPLAYHITFGTYGTRLHGDTRGTVHRSMNQPGDPIIGRDDKWQAIEKNLLRFEPVILTQPQRSEIETALPGIAERGGWSLHITAAQPDHVHVLLSTEHDPQAARKVLKRWLGQAVSIKWPLAPEQSWWSEGGSVKWVWDEGYFQNVFEYIRKQRALPWV
ncbi:MAG: hypothetical protein GC164_02700 [Phycisphaera sp.]|nr:hypothetical protein [Phycisphaera sp.]